MFRKSLKEAVPSTEHDVEAVMARLTLMINTVFDGARRVPFLYFTGDSLKNSFGQRYEGVVLRTLLLAL